MASDHDELSRYDKDKYTATFIPSNIFSNLKHELAAYAWNVNKIHSFQDGFFSPGILWYPRTLFALDIKQTTSFSNADLDYYERSAGPQLSTLISAYSEVPLVTGRLCQTLAGGGKRRIFAICNYVKQCLLTPIHDWSFEVLSKIPMDGTFDQEGPLRRLRDQGVGRNIYSFDLKSATVNSSLGLNNFLLTKQFVKKPCSVSFVVGQPLGYKGSWSLFALSHHYIVWCAAAKAYPDSTQPFTGYALLGDDIVIADECVAREYQRLLTMMGVSISLPKSIISNNGSCEFGKRFWVDSLKKDLSPISLKALIDCKKIRGLAQLRCKYNIERMSVLQRLGGAGFRVRSRLMSKQAAKWERLKVVASKTFGRKQLPLEFWIGRGNPLNPYLKGRMIAYLRRQMRPKEIKIFPQDLVFDGEREILERTVLRKWVEQWLKYCSWYHTKAMSDEVSIDDFFDAPICTYDWKRNQRDEKLIRWGHVWKLYDMAAGWSLETTPQFLFDPQTKISHSSWILGGYKGVDFIMSPVE